DPEGDFEKPVGGPWCYIHSDRGPFPARCLPPCGATYETQRKRNQVPHISVVAPLKINNNRDFTEHIGMMFKVDPAQKRMVFMKPSMEDHAEELLETKRYVFYACCGLVGAVIAWITICHFLDERVKRRRMAIVEVHRQALNATITRHRRESQAEHEEEDA
ncbi:hypothetical protein PMAYCL1PPCAC_26388, partial [Pristionchus mayeri]